MYNEGHGLTAEPIFMEKRRNIKPLSARITLFSGLFSVSLSK
jgi:hypothetical protein